MSIEIYEGKEAVVTSHQGRHHYKIGEKVRFLFKEKTTFPLFAFINEEGLRQTLWSSEFKWIEDDEMA